MDDLIASISITLGVFPSTMTAAILPQPWVKCLQEKKKDLVMSFLLWNEVQGDLDVSHCHWNGRPHWQAIGGGVFPPLQEGKWAAGRGRATVGSAWQDLLSLPKQQFPPYLYTWSGSLKSDCKCSGLLSQVTFWWTASREGHPCRTGDLYGFYRMTARRHFAFCCGICARVWLQDPLSPCTSPLELVLVPWIYVLVTRASAHNSAMHCNCLWGA